MADSSLIRAASWVQYVETKTCRTQSNKNLCAPQMPSSPCHWIHSQSYCRPARAMPTMHSTPSKGHFKEDVYLTQKLSVDKNLQIDLISSCFVKNPYPVGLNKCQTGTFLHHQCRLTTSFLSHASLSYSHINDHIHEQREIQIVIHEHHS